MRALKPLLLLAVLAVAALLWGRHSSEPLPQGGVVSPTAAPQDSVVSQEATTPVTAPTRNDTLPSFLPPEAADILRRIASGGPYEHRQDGVVFQNREGRLPAKPEGYYHEYTVDTPGLDYRGARRIITGGTPPQIYYYTDDHYRTFRQFEVSR
ncbi:ribonuclease domain-containing protein [Dyella japonica]|uniref:Ribonuclease n=1 Tax=Dyella japonica DSM 16301 TaxID=1440762 RepID=A0A0G9H4P6_9GAMM|nr:ribonuclease domain-containing protein [Dyella japonica]KLD64553.1 ribonuclease [Dyella japonica DSM 16301]